MSEQDPEFGGIIESPEDQTEDHVHEAVPKSEIASTISDLPSDFGELGLVDFADAAWAEADDAEDLPEPEEPDDKED